MRTAEVTIGDPTRDEVVKGLEQMLLEPALLLRDRDSLRAAISLLQPLPSDAEIEAARYLCDVNHKSDCRCEYCTVRKALDALAREPHYKDMLRTAVEQKLSDEDRIAALEAQVARVREVRDRYDAMPYTTLIREGVVRDLDAALAAAEPEVTL